MSVMSDWLGVLLAGDAQASEGSSSDESSGDESDMGPDPALFEQPLSTTPASPAFRDWEKHTRVSWHIFPYSPCDDASDALPQPQSVGGALYLTLTRFKARTLSLVSTLFLLSCPTVVFYCFRVLALA
jgi:hypothetical protein